MRKLSNLQAKMVAEAPDDATREMRRKTFTAPTVEEFKTTTKELPAAMAGAQNQRHVCFSADDGDATLAAAWNNLVLSCHMHDLKPVGYIDHVVDVDGKLMRFLRAILPN